MSREPIHTIHAPAAIGPYSQAVKTGNLVFMSGQIPLDPATGQLVTGEIEAETTRVFENLKAVAAAAGGCGTDRVDGRLQTAVGHVVLGVTDPSATGGQNR